MRQLLKSLLLFCIIALTSSCDYPAIEGYGDGSDIKSFSLSSKLVEDGGDLKIDMDLTVAFIANIYLREIVGDSGVDTSIYYTSVFAGAPKTLIYKYENGKLILDGVPVATVKEGQEYKIYAKVCDFTNSCLISKRETVSFGNEPGDNGTGGGGTTDNNTIDLEYLLLTDILNSKYAKMSFFANSIEKNLLVTNTQSADVTVSVNALNTINFSYTFGGNPTTTLAPGDSDNLTLKAVIDSIPISDVITDSYVKSGVFTFIGLTLPAKTVKVKPMKVVSGLCATYISGVNECNYNSDNHIFDLSASEPLAGFALDQALIDKLKAIPDAELKFDSDFFTKFKQDKKTTCVIDSNNVIATDKQCFVFISRNIAGATSNLIVTGTNIGVGGNGVSVNSIKFIFNGN